MKTLEQIELQIKVLESVVSEYDARLEGLTNEYYREKTIKSKNKILADIETLKWVIS